MLSKVKANVTFKVPAWNYCNLIKNGTLTQPRRERCRFCIKESGLYRCALYNEPLDLSESVLPIKTKQCKNASASGRAEVEDAPQIHVDPKVLMKSTIAEYDKLRKQLIGQGYPAALAEKLASEHLLKGGN